MFGLPLVAGLEANLAVENLYPASRRRKTFVRLFGAVLKTLSKPHCRKYRLEGDAVAASIDLAEIERAFALLFEAQGQPAEMAVFTRQEPGVMHCEVTAYFSPAALTLAHRFLAQPCKPPERQGIELLAGSVNCWQILFQR